MEYSDVREAAKHLDDRNDCTVVSVSIATGISYDEAFVLLKKAGRITGRGARTGIYHKVIRELGFDIQRINQDKSQTTFIPLGLHVVQAKTVRTIERELAAHYGGCMVMIHVKGHVLMWDGTKVIDWSAGRIYRVQQVYLIYKGNLPTGHTVPVPDQKSMNRVGCKRSAVRVTCAELDIHNKRFQSMPAAYKALNLMDTGRQQARKELKTYGWVEIYQGLKGEWTMVTVRFDLTE